MFSRLRYPIFFSACPFVIFPHSIQDYQLWLATSFLAYSLLNIAVSTFLRLYLL